MTRPMPGPPDEYEVYSMGGGTAPRIGWTQDGGFGGDFSLKHVARKRATPAESAAEFHAAHAEHLQVIIDNIGKSMTAGTYAPTLNRLAVMDRFATHPHALEVSE